jgi:hypothetical protein
MGILVVLLSLTLADRINLTARCSGGPSDALDSERTARVSNGADCKNKPRQPGTRVKRQPTTESDTEKAANYNTCQHPRSTTDGLTQISNRAFF